MAVKTNVWSPDTCGCQIEFTWDDSVPAASRTHTYSRTLVACPVHTALAGQASHLATITDRNQRKNFTFAELQTVLASVTMEQYAQYWSWNADHTVLIVNGTAAGLTANQRNTLQTRVNTRFGAGLVSVI